MNLKLKIENILEDNKIKQSSVIEKIVVILSTENAISLNSIIITEKNKRVIITLLLIIIKNFSLLTSLLTLKNWQDKIF